MKDVVSVQEIEKNCPWKLKLKIRWSSQIKILNYFYIYNYNKILLQTNLVTKIGGNNTNNFIKMIFGRLFSNRLATKYLWTGFRYDCQLQNLNLIKIIKINEIESLYYNILF